MIRTKSADYIIKDNSNTQFIKLKVVSDCPDCGMILHVSKLSDDYDWDIISRIKELSKGEYVTAQLERENKNECWKIHQLNKIYN